MQMIDANCGLPIMIYGPWGPHKWEDDIDTVVNALYACGQTLEYTAPSILRGWGRMEDRRCAD